MLLSLEIKGSGSCIRMFAKLNLESFEHSKFYVLRKMTDMTKNMKEMHIQEQI
jgi:hypothetical protein